HISSFLYFVLFVRRTPLFSLFPYTTLFRSLFVMIWSLLSILSASRVMRRFLQVKLSIFTAQPNTALTASDLHPVFGCAVKIDNRSEEHTSELQSRFDLVCRLLLEKKNILTNSLVRARLAGSCGAFASW